MRIAGLGYLGVATTRLDAWSEFATDVLGMSVTETGDGVRHVRMDDRAHRIVLREADAEGIDFVGWEVPDRQTLDDAATELERLGASVTRVSGDEAREQRDVAEFVAFNDPAGNQVEVFYGARTLSVPFINAHGSRFVTGELGLGHAFYVVDEFEETCAFYERLGFRLSDSSQAGSFRFYHCNPRQHSLGIGDAASPFELEKGLNHFMVEVEDIDAVGMAYDRCVAGRAPVSLTLGRHSNDRMFSFYAHTPSGWEIEYGSGGLRIDEETWVVNELAVESIWGHTPVGVEVSADAI
jgi:2,3-dihydroxybiphenyl 1,2-dioxygenase